MKKVILFSNTKKWWHECPDIDLMNTKISEMENEGWDVISISANTNFLGFVTSYTILLESSA